MEGVQCRFFGTSTIYLQGGVYDPRDPTRSFNVELLDADTGEVVGKSRADGRSAKSDVPHGHGFSLPIPESWLSSGEAIRQFQFRVVESGQLFPKVRRELPLARMLKDFERSCGRSAPLVAGLRDAAVRLDAIKGPDLLVVMTHELTRTGAPMIALSTIRHLVSKDGARVVLLTLGTAGKLYQEFSEVSELIVENLGECLKHALPETRKFFKVLATAAEQRVALSNSLCCGQLAVFCKEAGFKVISLVHEYPYAFSPDWVQNHFSAVESVVFPCRHVHQSFLKHGPGLLTEPHRSEPLKVSILPQGCYQLERPPLDTNEAVDFEKRFREENCLGADSRLVVSCGTLDSRKGFDWFASLIRHYGRTSPKTGTTHFLWIGGGGSPELFEHALHDMRGDGVIGQFHHISDMEDVRLAMRLADVFLLCSRIDPFPSVVLESFAMGVPVVGFDRDQGCAEMIMETRFGRVVPYQDLTAATTAIDHLLDGATEAMDVRKNGHAFVSENFSCQQYAEGIAALLRGEALPPAKPFTLGGGSAVRSQLPATAAGDGANVSPADAISRGLDFLAATQFADGEFPTLISSRESLDDGELDSSPFVTALMVHSLRSCLPRSRAMVERALAFLEGRWNRVASGATTPPSSSSTPEFLPIWMTRLASPL
ncbi:glycosyltransferase family 4 protein [Verrucomicrobium spinosum]|uniref:glycosyltransferase family 4 protein n=1 Tax=Verrucomicrobium spinosum TaxID=2736 RepID=UPI00155DAEF6|nr:glycosyltransferase family 4 protein [Verrucomicrobium spinosum]